MLADHEEELEESCGNAKLVMQSAREDVKEVWGVNFIGKVNVAEYAPIIAAYMNFVGQEMATKQAKELTEQVEHVAHQLKMLGNGDADTRQGGLEALGGRLGEALEMLAYALKDISSC